MFRTVIDSKNGKVWANHPLDQRMILVADVEEDADDYLKWSKMMGQIRNAPIKKVEAFVTSLEAHLKNIEKNVDNLLKKLRIAYCFNNYWTHIQNFIFVQ